MSKKDAKDTTEKKPPGAQTLGMGGMPSPGTEPEKLKQFAPGPRAVTEFARQHCTEVFAVALLQNPKIDIFLLGNPLDPGGRGDAPNAGALLARCADRMAGDYLAAVANLHRTAAPTQEPMLDAIPNIERGDLVTDPGNDFPQD